MKAPDRLSVEINGLRNRTLMIFANPPERDAPCRGDENTIYYGPGEHMAEGPEQIIRLLSGQTLYLAGGALVTGVVLAENAENVKIMGRGILHGEKLAGRWPSDQRHMAGWPADAPSRRNMAVFNECRGIEISGVTFVDSPAWTVMIQHSEDIFIDNVKIIGYHKNNDGIDICGSRNAVVRDCFIRCSDDGIVVKCLHDRAGRNIGATHYDVSGCAIWADAASAIEIGHEECAPEVAHMRFTDIDILGQTEETYGYHAIDITNTDFADIHDIVFEDIRIERCARMFGARVREGVFGRSGYSKGRIRDVTLRNIRCDGDDSIFLAGRDEASCVYDIRLEDIIIKGRPLTSLDGVYRNPYVRDVKLIAGGKEIDSLKPYPAPDECVPMDIGPMCNMLAGRDNGLFGMASED
jgi:hypothetical protein